MNKYLVSVLFLCLLGLPLRAQMDCDRGYDLERPSAVVVKKGHWMAGGSIGFSSSTSNNNNFVIINGINSKFYDIDFCPQFCYMLGDNIGVGGRFSYKRNLFDIDSAHLSLDSFSLSVQNYAVLTHRYALAGFFRYYKPFGTTGRFGAYVDAELSLGGQQQKLEDGHKVSEPVKGTFSNGFTGALGAYTGLLAFFTSHLAMDVRVGLFSLNLSTNNQVHNLLSEGHSNFHSVNFMVDLLAIQFGFHYYL
ncbi:MAG: hypothetical protein IIX64_01525 [Bacteroidales bacterium]|nr:hypothetical protein [Bacteroidales bacterium]